MNRFFSSSFYLPFLLDQDSVYIPMNVKHGTPLQPTFLRMLASLKSFILSPISNYATYSFVDSPPPNMFFKQAKLRPTIWPQSEAVSLGFCKEQNPLKTIRMKTIHTLSLWLQSYPDSGSAWMGPEASAENSSPGPTEGWPTSIIPQPPVRVGWDLNLQPQAWARGGGWEKMYTCPQPFPVTIEVPKILSLSPKLYETSPSWWILGTFLFAVLCLQLS